MYIKTYDCVLQHSITIEAIITYWSESNLTTTIYLLLFCCFQILIEFIDHRKPAVSMELSYYSCRLAYIFIYIWWDNSVIKYTHVMYKHHVCTLSDAFLCSTCESTQVNLGVCLCICVCVWCFGIWYTSLYVYVGGSVVGIVFVCECMCVYKCVLTF